MDGRKLIHYNHQLEASPGDKVRILKHKIFEVDDVLAPERCYYLVEGEFLDDERLLRHYNMSNCAQVHVVKRMTVGKLFLDEAQIRREEDKKRTAANKLRRKRAKQAARRMRRQERAQQNRLQQGARRRRRNNHFGGNIHYGQYGYYNDNWY